MSGIPCSHFQKIVRTLLSLGVAATLVLVGFVGGALAAWSFGPEIHEFVSAGIKGPVETPSVEENLSERLALLTEIWRILEDEYIAPQDLDLTKMVYGAASGFVSAIGDPHTAFVEPMQAAIMQEDMQGSFEGIGATVEMVDGVLTIVRPLPDSPAERAGLKAGDQILEVDGEPLEGKSLTEAITLIRGPRGTVVRLLIKREGVAEPFLVSITRERVEIQTTEARMLEGDIAYLALAEFNAKSAQRVHEDLENLLALQPKGLIFDLRNNPGGYLEMAVRIASEFLPQGTVIVTEELREGPGRVFRASRGGIATDIPLVVLVNGGSASASEIVAGAIQDHQRGVLIGEKTFGKGSVQHTHTLSDGSNLRVTVAQWVLPSGRILENDGLEPDITVVNDQALSGKDNQLERAIAYLLENR